MIISFGDDANADLYHGIMTNRVRRFSPTIIQPTLRKLDMLNSVNHLEALRGYNED